MSPKHFAQRLGRLIDLSDSVRLSTVHSQMATMAGETTETRDSIGGGGGGDAIAAEFLRVHTAIVQSLLRSFVPGARDTAIKLPPSDIDVPPEGAKAYQPYRHFYTAQQREIHGKVQRLQSQAREAVSAVSSELAQLSALDKALGDILAPHTRKIYFAIPRLLGQRYACLHLEYMRDETTKEQLHEQFCREMQGLLLAELETRLLPVLGIIETLPTNTDQHTYEPETL